MIYEKTSRSTGSHVTKEIALMLTWDEPVAADREGVGEGVSTRRNSGKTADGLSLIRSVTFKDEDMDVGTNCMGESCSIPTVL